jgi:hypothetical protein
MSRIYIGMFLMLAAVASLTVSSAIAAPKELYGKSIVVSWTEDRIQRASDQTQFQSMTVAGKFSAYVSSQGRIFSRNTMQVGRRVGSAERVGDEGNSHVSFAGRSLVAVQMSEHGARRIVVEFDLGFTSCTAEVIRGKETGAASLTANSLIRSGIKVEIQSVKTSNVSCSMRDGNVFGDVGPL